jgi:hypothetical protein
MKPLTVRDAVPVIFQYRQFDAAGGLLSYGRSETEYCRRIGTYSRENSCRRSASPPRSRCWAAPTR